MADPFDAPLPTTGQKPWSLNPAIEEVRDRILSVDNVIETGRLSPEGLSDEIVAAAADLNPEVLSDSFIASQISAPVSESKSAVSNQIDSVAEAVNVSRYGVVGDGVTSDSAALLSAINAANGKPLLIPRGMKVKAAITVTDKSINLVGGGTLVQAAGTTALSVTHNFGTPFPCTVSSKQVGVNTPGTTVFTEQKSILRPSDNSYTRFNAGDVYHLSSQDMYPWATVALPPSGNVWKAAFVPVHGIGIEITSPTGAIAEGATVTGASSGAVAQLDSVMAISTGTIAVARSISANFSIGETIQVSGSASGTVSDVYLISATILDDTYTTSPQLRKVQTDKIVNVEVDIEPAGDPSAFVGTSSRAAAMILSGVYNPRINTTVRGAWSRAVQANSIYLGQFRVSAPDGLPNHASSGEQAYGYGIEFRGAAEGADVVVVARRVRHAFTTNVTGTTYGNNIFSYGTVKRISVHDSLAINTFSAGFDTHEGSNGVVFDNCRTVSPSATGRFQSTPTGFNNRGFNTLVRNCVAENCVVGFSEGGVTLPNDFNYTNRYENSVVIGYSRYGYYQDSAAADTFGKIEIVNVDARGDGTAQNTPYYQAGFYLRAGKTDLTNSRASKFNGAPIQIVSASTSLGDVVISGFTADYRESSTSAGGLRVQGADSNIRLTNGYTAIGHSNGTTPVSVLRNNSNNVNWYLHGDINSVGWDIPLWAIDTGTPVIQYRKSTNNIRPIAIRGNAGATLHSRTDSPTQIWNTPLTGDRTVTFSTSVTIVNGDSFRIVRAAAATGSANLIVLGKNLAAGQWVDVMYDGSSWNLIGFGSL